jgi:hypothetical protein
MMAEVRAPFPWFGGKRRVADVVWRAFGVDVPNYVEPFAGSLAVLLGRPGGAGKIETVNDLDRYLANFWRAVTADPEAVARHANWPVNEADLHARHQWLVNQAEFRERMHTDPDFFDAKIAGWWVWGLCQWIGGGWCVEPQNHKHPKLDGIGKGVHSARGHRKRPNLAGMDKGVLSKEVPHHKRQLPDLAVPARALTTGRGVHRELSRQLPSLRVDSGAAGMGIHASGLSRKLPNLAVKADGACAGRGILSDAAVAKQSREPSSRLPAIGNDRGLNGVAAPPCLEWFLSLQERLRRVRVACGDWKRVLGDSVLGKGKNVGGRRPCAVFLDPPYSHEFRNPGLYTEDAADVSAQVRAWAIEHGEDPDLRIALCGYAGEHQMPSSWTVHVWKAARGYAGAANTNRARERIWFSPHCLPLERSSQQMSLLGCEGRSA